MKNPKDFVIRFGVLKEYRGEGGSIVVPQGIKKIGCMAFQNCKTVTEITFPEGVTEIKKLAFYRCPALKAIHLPSSLMKIEDMAFRDCTGLKQITCSSANSTFSSIDGFLIDKNQHRLIAFWDKEKNSCQIPDGVKKISSYAFAGAEQLTHIRIPQSVNVLDQFAPSGCKNLKEIHVSDANLSYASRDGALYDKEFRTLLQFPQGLEGSFQIPAGVQKIAAWAFGYGREYSGITSLVIPESEYAGRG